MRGGTHLHEGHDLVGDLVGQPEIRAGQRGAHGVGAALVEFVDLAQHQRLAFALGNAQAFEEAAQQLAVVQLDGEIAHAQLGEHRVDDGGHLGVMAHAERVLADHVDVALVELAEAAALGTLAPVHALDLVAPEREGQVVFVLGHVAGQRHGEVEAQGQFGLAALFKGAGGLHEIHLPLGFAAGFGQQHFGQLENRRFHRQEAEAFIVAADDVQHALEGNLVTGQQLHDPGRGAGLDQGRQLQGEPAHSSGCGRPGASPQPPPSRRACRIRPESLELPARSLGV